MATSISIDRNIAIIGKSRKTDISKPIIDSMVLWYDLKRQGATNETMRTNPKLIDLSGNGHDAACYNFAWAGMSSIGGYKVDFTSWNVNSLQAIRNNDHSVTIYRTGNDSSDAFGNSLDVPNSFTINVSGLEQGIRLEFGQGTIAASDKSIYEDGTYTVEHNVTSGNVGFKLYSSNGSEISGLNVTIEILPEYPNALVSDGVDDYALVKELSPLTDYTVIAKRKLLSTDATTYGGIAKRSRIDLQEYGAFVVEKDSNRCYSFGTPTLNIVPSDKDIIYQTTYNYCGTELKAGKCEDTDFLIIFAGLYNLDNNNKVSEFRPMILYQVLLFNRTLTDKEIQWVKTNLIEGDFEL